MMSEKSGIYCKRCLKPTQLTEEFYLPHQLRNPRRRSWCRSCHLEYERERIKNKPDAKIPKKAASLAWYSRNKELAFSMAINHRLQKKIKIDAIKEASPCMDCRNFFPAVCMDFDHRDPTKKVAPVSYLLSIAGSPWPEIEAEISKCDLVCSNCHRIRTRDRRKAKACSP